MLTTYQGLLDLLAASLFSKPRITVGEAAGQEALQQAVYPLISGDKQALGLISRNMQIAWQQQELVSVLQAAAVPFAVLKGLAAAQYYPEPMRRILGDIDIIVAPEDYSKAYSALKGAGFQTKDPALGEGRHIHFKKNGVTVELHRRYAVLNTRAAVERLDSWIYAAIASAVTVKVDVFSFPALPEPLNGLTLLAHINQHLEEGLGIRQLIDWVIYVSKELPDEKWPAFRSMTDQLGLTKLARHTARFGQLYLGLPEERFRWCMDADDAVCEALAEYVFTCGNFGHKDSTGNTVAMVFSHSDGLRGAFRNLQSRGESNWETYQKHRWLKPFCWLYQAFRYARLGLKRENAFSNLKKDYASSKRRNELMTALGATRLVKREMQ